MRIPVLGVIFVAILALGGSALLVATGCYQSYDWKEAERAAKATAAKIRGTTGEVECTHVDTDDDGYCSCTLFFEAADPQLFECGCPKEKAGSGCTGEQVTGCKPVQAFKMVAPGGK